MFFTPDELIAQTNMTEVKRLHSMLIYICKTVETNDLLLFFKVDYLVTK